MISTAIQFKSQFRTSKSRFQLDVINKMNVDELTRIMEALSAVYDINAGRRVRTLDSVPKTVNDFIRNREVPDTS